MPKSRRYLVGVSGGVDSVVLLDLLIRLGFRNLVVCHLNHSLRGRESGGDAAAVRRIAKTFALPFLTAKIDVRKEAARANESLETTARRARHDFFKKASREHRCRRVVLAHHVDDQAETVLMAVLRGSGLNGLTGMSETTEIEGLTFLRPFLVAGWAREDVRLYAKIRRLSFREDSSNKDLAFTRNRVRHQLLPLALKVMGREVSPALLRLAKIAKRDDAILTNLANDALELAENIDGSLSLPAIVSLEVGLLHRVLRTWLQAAEIPNLSEELVRRVAEIVPPNSKGAKENLSGGAWVRRKAGRLFIQHPSLKKED